MDDELNLDRVIDAPVYQDVLTWDVFELGVVNVACALSCLTSQIPYGVCNDEVRCGLLADS
jgi:hypothetical protein